MGIDSPVEQVIWRNQSSSNFNPSEFRKQLARGSTLFSELRKSPDSNYKNELEEIINGIDSDDPVNIQFTSGTTGQPKGPRAHLTVQFGPVTGSKLLISKNLVQGTLIRRNTFTSWHFK